MAVVIWRELTRQHDYGREPGSLKLALVECAVMRDELSCVELR